MVFNLFFRPYSPGGDRKQGETSNISYEYQISKRFSHTGGCYLLEKETSTSLNDKKPFLL